VQYSFCDLVWSGKKTGVNHSTRILQSCFVQFARRKWNGFRNIRAVSPRDTSHCSRHQYFGQKLCHRKERLLNVIHNRGMRRSSGAARVHLETVLAGKNSTLSATQWGTQLSGFAQRTIRTQK
jgi:hypothetical protein